MKKKIFAIILTATLLFGITMAVSAEDAIKSQGNIVFDNGTSTSEDDVIFSAGDLTALNSRIDQLTTDVTTGKGKIAASIKAKDSTSAVSDTSSYDVLKDGIDKIGIKGTVTASDVVTGKTFFNGTGYTTGNLALTGNTQAAYVLSGTTFYNNSFTKQTGTMINKSGSSSSANVTVNGNTGTVPIPANGYYDTSSNLTIDLTSNNNYYYEQGKAEGTGKIRRISLGSVSGDINIDVKPYYDDWGNLTADNFALDGCYGEKNGAQGQNNWSGSYLSTSWDASNGIFTVTKVVVGDPPASLELSSEVVLFVSD